MASTGEQMCGAPLQTDRGTVTSKTHPTSTIPCRCKELLKIMCHKFLVTFVIIFKVETKQGMIISSSETLIIL